MESGTTGVSIQRIMRRGTMTDCRLLRLSIRMLTDRCITKERVCFGLLSTPRPVLLAKLR
jgi:hypothetical protein